MDEKRKTKSEVIEDVLKEAEKELGSGSHGFMLTSRDGRPAVTITLIGRERAPPPDCRTCSLK